MTLTELYKETPLGPVNFNGMVVQRDIEFPVNTGDRFEFTVLKQRLDVKQVIHVHGYDCSLDVDGTRGSVFVLWTEGLKPNGRKANATVLTAKTKAIFRVYNGWQPPHTGAVDAFLNESGMNVVRIGPGDEEHFLFRCSSGYGPVDFDSLVFELKIIRAKE